jgi:hypothetical protein
MIKVHYIHVWKYHKESPLYIQYALVKKRKTFASFSEKINNVKTKLDVILW